MSISTGSILMWIVGQGSDPVSQNWDMGSDPCPNQPAALPLLRRYSLGDVPVVFFKARRNLEYSPKAHVKAISVSDISLYISSFAFSILLYRIYS